MRKAAHAERAADHRAKAWQPQHDGRLRAAAPASWLGGEDDDLDEPRKAVGSQPATTCHAPR
eukprot:4199133-Prymnesium_polylepis.2